MKIQETIARTAYRHRNSERGMATVVLIALLGIMLILVTGTTLALWHLKRDLQLVDHKQRQAWAEGKVPSRNVAPAESPEPNVERDEVRTTLPTR